MRKTLLALALLGAVGALAAPAMAQSNTAVGVGTGVVTGAIVGGPVGAVVGGVAGGVIGSSTEPRRRYVRYSHRRHYAHRRHYSAR